MAAHLHLTPIIPCDMFVTAALLCDIDECTLGFEGWRLLLERFILRESLTDGTMSCAGGVLYWTISDYYGGPFFKIVGWSLIVSRCTAMLMIPIFSLCLLAVCRHTMTFLR